MKSPCSEKWARTYNPSIPVAAGWQAPLVSRRKNTRCRRPWVNECSCLPYEIRPRARSSFPTVLVAGSKSCKPRDAVRFIWPKPCNSVYRPSKLWFDARTENQHSQLVGVYFKCSARNNRGRQNEERENLSWQGLAACRLGYHVVVCELSRSSAGRCSEVRNRSYMAQALAGPHGHRAGRRDLRGCSGPHFRSEPRRLAGQGKVGRNAGAPRPGI